MLSRTLAKVFMKLLSEALFKESSELSISVFSVLSAAGVVLADGAWPLLSSSLLRAYLLLASFKFSRLPISPSSWLLTL